MKKFTFVFIAVLAALILTGCPGAGQDPESGPVTYALRDTGPAGGLIFYIDELDEFSWDYLEAAPSDQSTGIEWIDVSNQSIPITLSIAADVGQGAINTAGLVSIIGTGNYAAELCDSLAIGDFSDWFLPSSHELQHMYTNLKPAGVGGFSNGNYWSSTEIQEILTNYRAYSVNFSTGSVNNDLKVTPNRVRAARFVTMPDNDPPPDYGELDTSFGTNGVVTRICIDGGSYDYGFSVALDSSDDIYVAGSSYVVSTKCMAIWKNDSSGASVSDFDTDGYVNFFTGSGRDASGKSIVLDGDENIYIAGYSENASDMDMVIWKYNSNGSLDTSFKGAGSPEGYQVYNNTAGGTAGNDYGNAVTLDSSGNICVVGSSFNGTDDDMVIWKFNNIGLRISDFNLHGVNGAGIVVHDNAAGGTAGNDCGYSITADSVGNIYITGYSDNGTNDDMVIWKYKSNGLPDTGFGTSGIVVHDNAAGGNEDDFGKSIILDSSGNIYVAGYSHNGSNYDMVIWKYDSSGDLDSSFGTGGIVVHNNAAGGNEDDSGYSIVLESTGSIRVTGRSFNGINYDMVIWKYDSSGDLDGSFGTGGIDVYRNGGNDAGVSMVLDSSGKVFVTGYTYGQASDMSIWKYH